MSIQVNNISKTFDGKKVLSSINFKAEAGDIIGLIGPNGAGKSTIMKIITGLYPPNEGTVYICGENIQINTTNSQKKIGYLAEENPLYQDMYVAEFLEFICDVHKINSNKAKEMIDLTGLIKVKNQKIKTLSKGFKQRVGIAQALIHNPDIIILDEPTSVLDPKQLIEIRKIITNLGKDKTIILSTHILQEVEAMCNRIIIINQGKLIIDEKIQTFDKKIEEKFLQLIK